MIDLKTYETRKQKLDDLKLHLKNKFIGLDDIINQIVDNISIWYLMPELQSRPLIISLWGTTGVGKTDLVRTLTKFLDFNDRFVEIQLDNGSEYRHSIESVMVDSGIDAEHPSILLLDEMQRFRSLDENGDILPKSETSYFNDIWMLLSDGVLQSNSTRKDEIYSLYMEELYDIEYAKREEEQKTTKTKKTKSHAKLEKIVKPFKYQTWAFQAKKLKRLLRLDDSVETIMKLNARERTDMLKSALEDNSTFEGESYKKLLIFISGNLDEAFQMSDSVDDVEQDADIYHEFSKQINILNIKKALLKKFKPEQISRFGNTHIIYPILNRVNYENLIKRHCGQIAAAVKAAHGIEIKFTEAVYDVIYINGVFPVQGVRPVFSTITDFIENNLPYFLFSAAKQDQRSMLIDYANGKLTSTIKDETITRDIKLVIENIRVKKTIDEKALYMVHELGHSLVYAKLFGCAPAQITLNAASTESEGFVSCHMKIEDKAYILKDLIITMAGQAAEEVVFGSDVVSQGVRGDITYATKIASNYVRRFGMDAASSAFLDSQNDQNGVFNHALGWTDEKIEELVNNAKQSARIILTKHKYVLQMLLRYCLDEKKISTSDFVRICTNYGLPINKKEIQDKIVSNYYERLTKFIGKE